MGRRSFNSGMFCYLGSLGQMVTVFLLAVVTLKFDESGNNTRASFAVCDKNNHPKLSNKSYFMNQLEKDIIGCFHRVSGKIKCQML